MNDFIIKIALSDAEEMYLKNRFFEILRKLKIKENRIEEIFERLYFEYTDWSRHFHNLSHIYSLLKLSEKLSHLLNNPVQVDLAIMFHDVVYNTSKKDNELQSSIIFEEFLGPYLEKDELKQIKSLILSTSVHLPLISEDNDHQYFLDFDLAIFSTHRDVYKQYSEAIREEYKSIISFFTYNSGRKKILKSFLTRKSIYLSPFFREKYELAARENLEWEIRMLSMQK